MENQVQLKSNVQERKMENRTCKHQLNGIVHICTQATMIQCLDQLIFFPSIQYALILINIKYINNTVLLRKGHRK